MFNGNDQANGIEEGDTGSRQALCCSAGVARSHMQRLTQASAPRVDDVEMGLCVRISGPVDSGRSGFLYSPAFIANLARAYVASGKRSEAVKLLSDLKKRSTPGYSNSAEIAVIYASLGDKDQAMNWLEKGYEERFDPGVLLRPGFDPLRSDKRFQDLLHRIGLPS
jgi:hypothetical protein